MVKSYFSTMEDKKIWESFKSGNREVFERIFRTHIRVLYKYGSRFTHDPALVEDCIQDLFLDLWHKRQSLGTTDSIKRYLLGSLRRRIIRKLQHKPSNNSSVELENYDFHLELNAEDERIEVESGLAQQKALKEAMAQLTQRQREVIYLKYFQEMSYEEIASVMEISYQSTRNLVYAALKLMKKHMVLIIVIFLLFFEKFYH
jgi:RNA polymerase sigma factor (sigma-70 family)